MPLIRYIKRKFSPESQALIKQANRILRDFGRRGFRLTLRQLYYQFVSKGLIPNTPRSYKNLGSVVNSGRLAGEIDWDHIEDRTRNLRKNSHWSTPADIINSAASSYRLDMWATQTYRPEVWIEKDALVGVIEGICSRLDVPYFACRGYNSQSEMWGAAQRLLEWRDAGQKPIILHLGDHDPSGMDMTRDTLKRMRRFGSNVEIDRLALNMDQIRAHNPPPNPAKVTDSRAAGYIAEFGDSSWELDALDPDIIVGLVRDAIEELIDREPWDAKMAEFKRERFLLRQASGHWNELVTFLEENYGHETDEEDDEEDTSSEDDGEDEDDEDVDSTGDEEESEDDESE